MGTYFLQTVQLLIKSVPEYFFFKSEKKICMQKICHSKKLLSQSLMNFETSFNNFFLYLISQILIMFLINFSLK